MWGVVWLSYVELFRYTLVRWGNEMLARSVNLENILQSIEDIPVEGPVFIENNLKLSYL